MSWHRPAGSLTRGRDPVALDPESAGWKYSGLHVLDLAPGESRRQHFPGDELVLVPLTGSFEIASEAMTASLTGRTSVFTELTDRVYLPPDVPFQVSTDSGGELAVAGARVEQGGDARYVPAAETTVELRGAGQASRQINGLYPADMTGPEKLIVVEVLTPSGNWSSYPPHKHDEWGEGEAPLEEIYYFRIDGADGFGLHRTYTSDGAFDETVAVGDGDVYVIPRGYHGPCVAAPGYPMYYLNVMAGPERAWLICTDPSHAWLLEDWKDVPVDPRLPMTEREKG